MGVTLAQLNAAGRRQFVEALGSVFEQSAWVADRAWSRRPFEDLDALHRAMTTVVDEADREHQLHLLRAHPDLGARARMSEASAGEQAAAGLDRLTAGELEKLQRLNALYRERFAFPFLYAVKGSTPDQVIAALEQRVDRDPDEEFAEALRQVARIARFRLEELIRESSG